MSWHVEAPSQLPISIVMSPAEFANLICGNEGADTPDETELRHTLINLSTRSVASHHRVRMWLETVTAVRDEAVQGAAPL